MRIKKKRYYKEKHRNKKNPGINPNLTEHSDIKLRDSILDLLLRPKYYNLNPDELDYVTALKKATRVFPEQKEYIKRLISRNKVTNKVTKIVAIHKLSSYL